MTLASLLALAAAITTPPTYKVTQAIAGPDGGWDLASVDPSAHRLYVARSAAIMAVDLATGRVTPSLISVKAGTGSSPFQVPTEWWPPAGLKAWP